MLNNLVKIINTIGTEQEIAILCRTNYNCSLVESKLKSANIKHKKYEGISNITHNQQFRFELACLRLLANPHNNPAVKTIYKYYFPDNLLQFKLCQLESLEKNEILLNIIAQQYPLFQRFIQNREQYKYAYDAVYKFLPNMPIGANYSLFPNNEKTFLQTLADAEPYKLLVDFLSDLSMSSIQDSLINQDDNNIKVMTVHAAKGLEFDNVIIFNAIEGVFPIKRKNSDPEEERRIFYVAITRAKEKLWILTESGKESSYLKESGLTG